MRKKRKLRGLPLLLLVMLSLSTPLSVAITDQNQRPYPLTQDDAEIQRALEYLHTLQNNDGGFSNPGEGSAMSNTQWAIMALVAAGEDPHEWRKNGHSPVDYLHENAHTLLGSTDYERMILALVAAGENPRDFAGRDFVAELKNEYLKENGQFSDFIYTTIWGILALSAAGEDASRSAAWLKEQQNTDGGFAWVPGERSDYDDTAAALQALIAAGESPDSAVIRDAIEYLKTGQNEDGGFKYFGTSPSNAASDAWVIQAIVACGQDPVDKEWYKNGNNSVNHLLSLQQSDGSFNYTSYTQSNPGFMTVCAIMALRGKPFPIKKEIKGEETLMLTTTLIPSPTATISTSSPTPAHMQTLTPTPLASSPVTPAATTSPAQVPEEKPPTVIPSFEFISVILALLTVDLSLRFKNSRLR